MATKKATPKNGKAVSSKKAESQKPNFGQTAKIKGKTITPKSVKTQNITAASIMKAVGKARATKAKEITDKKVKAIKKEAETKVKELKAVKRPKIELVWERMPERDKGKIEAYDAYFIQLCEFNLATPDGFVAFVIDMKAKYDEKVIEQTTAMKKNIDLRKFRKETADSLTDFVGTYKTSKGKTVLLIVHD